MAFHCGYLVWWYVEQHASHMFIITFWHGNGNVLFDCMQFFFRWFLGQTFGKPHRNTHHKSNKTTLKYFIFVWNHSHIHKYLITTFNKEYITLQGIQTSTFFFLKNISQHVDILHWVRGLLRSVRGLEMQDMEAGSREGGLLLSPPCSLAAHLNMSAPPYYNYTDVAVCVCVLIAVWHKKNTNETKRLTCLRSVVEASVTAWIMSNKNKNTSQT